MTEIQIERKNLPLGLLVSLSNCPVSQTHAMIGGSRATSDEPKVEVCFFKKIFPIEGYREVSFALVAGFIGKADLDNFEHVESSGTR